MTRLRRSSTIAIAMLCLVAQLFAVAHLVLVRHARCAEHGEVTHAAEATHTEAPRAPGVDAVLAANDAGAATDDDHCEWLSERRDIRHASAPVFTVVPVAHVAPATGELIVLAVTRPLYRLAPKLSPPRLVA